MAFEYTTGICVRCGHSYQGDGPCPVCAKRATYKKSWVLTSWLRSILRKEQSK